jgi:hypothetical protein
VEEEIMKWEELRKILNDIAESPDKAALQKNVTRMGEEAWCLELMVNAISGNLVFVDAMDSEDAG